MKVNLLIKAVLLVAVVTAMSSCATSKRVRYLSDMEYGKPVVDVPAPELRFQKNDNLTIKVYSEAVELTKPFHLVSSSDAGDASIQYQVDSLGRIDFPVLGQVHVEGMTAKELETHLASMIRSTGYITDPVVRVKLDNFSITVIGAAANKVMTIDDDNVNILQVLAKSGGTNVNCDLKDVMVIRTENGFKTAYKVNLRSKELYNSPVYYLQQNDVVYFKQKGAQMTSSGSAAVSILSPMLSIASIVTNILLWSTRR